MICSLLLAFGFVCCLRCCYLVEVVIKFICWCCVVDEFRYVYDCSCRWVGLWILWHGGLCWVVLLCSLLRCFGLGCGFGFVLGCFGRLCLFVSCRWGCGCLFSCT